jgi:hypothetical protein
MWFRVGLLPDFPEIKRMSGSSPTLNREIFFLDNNNLDGFCTRARGIPACQRLIVQCINLL